MSSFIYSLVLNWHSDRFCHYVVCQSIWRDWLYMNFTKDLNVSRKCFVHIGDSCFLLHSWVICPYQILKARASMFNRHFFMFFMSPASKKLMGHIDFVLSATFSCWYDLLNTVWYMKRICCIQYPDSILVYGMAAGNVAKVTPLFVNIENSHQRCSYLAHILKTDLFKTLNLHKHVPYEK